MDNNTGQDFKVEEIIEYLSDKDMAIDFLKDHGIGDIESVHEIQKYKRDYAHRGLILRVKEKGNDSRANIMIDIKWGQPTIEQVFSAIYENGSECSKRIIMFTGGVDAFEKDDPGAHEYVVQSLVNAMNDYPLGLYLVKTSGRDLETKAFGFEVVTNPEDSAQYELTILPSVEKFREAEFWCVYFDSLNEGLYVPLEAFDGCLTEQNRCWYSIYGGFAHIFAEWTEDGLILTAKMRRSDPNFLIKLFNSRGIEIQELFLGSEIESTVSPGESSEVSIKVWNFPLKRLLNATSEEKTGYARLLRESFDKFNFFFQGAVCTLEK